MFRRRGTGRPSDDRAMGLLREKMRRLAPGLADHAVVEGGVLLEPHAGWSVAVLPNHTDSPLHFDLALSAGAGQPPLVDCVSGLGEGKRGFETLLHIWAETSGACFLEMLTGQGFAEHLPETLPGWHTISSGVIGYGPDDQSNEVMQAAMLDSDLLRVIGGDLVAGFDRPAVNGLKVYLCRTPDTLIAEVRINGQVAGRATDALARLPWPAVRETAVVRFYAVAVHPV